MPAHRRLALLALIMHGCAGGTPAGSTAPALTSPVACSREDEFIPLIDHCLDPATCTWQRFSPAACGGAPCAGQDVTAELQAALDALSQERPVLYIPAGDYTLSGTIHIFDKIGFTIAGEDPLLTRFVWAGDAGDAMFVFDGINAARVERFTVDGGERGAAAGIQQVRTRCPASGSCPPGYAAVAPSPDGYKYSLSTSNVDYSDLVFANLELGLAAGEWFHHDGGHEGWIDLFPYRDYPDAQDSQANNDNTSIRRCAFENISQEAVAITGFNALPFEVWDSSFFHCHRGVDVASGTVNVWNSSFARSDAVDVNLPGPVYAEVRGNRSYDSAAFIDTGSTYAVQVIDNDIYSQVATGPVIRGAATELLVQGNRITVPPGQTAIELENYIAYRHDVVYGDNQFSGQAAELVDLATLSVTHAVDLGTNEWQQVLAPPVIAMPAFAPTSARSVLVLEPGKNAADLQAIIDHAAPGDVVWVPARSLELPATLTVGVKDLVITGDGPFTDLVPVRPPKTPIGEPVFDLPAPAQVTLRDLRIRYDVTRPTSYQASGIVVHAASDDPGNVYADRLFTGAVQTGVELLDVDRIGVRLDSSNMHSETGFHVRGGGLAAAGSDATRGVRMFGGALSPYLASFAVEGWGKLMLEGIDFETGAQAAELSAPAYVSIVGGRQAITSMETTNHDWETSFPGVPNYSGTAGFEGRFLLAHTATTAGMLFQPATAASVMALGVRDGPADFTFDELTPGFPLPTIEPDPAFYASLDFLQPIDCTFATLAVNAQHRNMHSWGSVANAIPWTDHTVRRCHDFQADWNPIIDALHDLAAASSAWPELACGGGTDVRIDRVIMEGAYGVGPEGAKVQRPLVTALRVQLP